MRQPLVNTSPMMTRINVTPIIDVALVLVIILLITAPMMAASDLDIELPAAHSREDKNEGFISITLGTAGEIAIDEQLIAGIDQIQPALVARIGQQESDIVSVIVRADAGLPHALVRQVLEQARLGGATRLGIATRQEGGGS